MKSFLFYDIETSGLNPAFDQVLTFACIRTDLSLTELSREVITVQLRPDIVPSPGAFLTHGLTPEELETGIVEYQAALKIHKLFNTPESISIGYNSLGFDDEFLRFLFYRNLLDPYSHQFAHGCSRMDMLPVAAVYYLFCSQALSWPVLEGGKPSLKLEHLSRENKFVVSGKAHEAMADVEALLSLSRKFAAQKEIWEYVLGFFDKRKDVKRIAGLKNAVYVENNRFELGLMVSVSFGAKMNYIAPVIHIGGSIPYKNQTLWIRLDQEGLLDGTDEDHGIYDLFVIRKRPGDQVFVLPCLDRFMEKLTPGARSASKKNLSLIKGDSELFIKTASYHKSFRYPEIPDIDPDAGLYEKGFFSPGEKQEIARFHQSDEKNRKKVCGTFKSARGTTLAQRILARNFNHTLSPPHEFSSHMARLSGEGDHQVKGYKNDVKFTCAHGLAEIEQIEAKEGLDPASQKMLAWLKRHIVELSASFAEPF
ncbi:MAG: exodeoxyribonuclease I [Desulfobacter sp.]|nr:exodeoxyribonuclease I [Desulfobacter sp.]WDP85931.1 MAG: exodeoxyribonuclease I [Desulfobacter sp.]